MPKKKQKQPTGFQQSLPLLFIANLKAETSFKSAIN